MLTTDKLKTVVYQARNLLNGHRYIGVTKQGLAKRQYGHIKDARTGRGNRFHNAIRKYGEEYFVFGVVHDFDDDYDLARLYEHELICKERPEYNLTYGGEGGAMHQSTKDKLRAANLGRKASVETRAKIALAMAGRPPTKGRTGQPRKTEEREKIRTTLQKRQWVDTPARQASRARTGTSAAQLARRVPVLCENDGLHYESVKDAAVHYGLNATKLAAAIRVDKAYKGLRFRRVRDTKDAGTFR